MSDVSDDHALVLQISADNAKMLRAFETAVSKIDGYSTIIEARAKKMATGLESAFSTPNFGKALDNTFNAARLQVMSAATSQIGAFGAGLGLLGPIGIGAAVGVAAFAFSMDQASKAVDFAANVEKLSQTIGVSTDFIQKFNFAAHQNEIDVGIADESLKKFNVTLGLVQSGLAKAQMTKGFAALGFTPEQLRQYHDAGDLFPVLADRIAKIGNAAEEAAVAKRLGMEDLLPLLKLGAAGFSELAQKAADLGIVMDAATVHEAAEAKKKLVELDDVMKAKSEIAFAKMADQLIAVKEGFLNLELAALKVMSNVAIGIQGVLHPLQALEVLLGGLTGNKAMVLAGSGPFVHPAAPAPPPPSARDVAARQLVPGAGHKPRGGGSKTDETGGFDKAAQDAYESGLKALLSAQAALMTDILQRASAEKAAVDADSAKKLTDLSAEEVKIRAAKNDKHKAEQLSLIEKAKTEEQNVAAAKKELIDRNAVEAVRLKELELAQAKLAGTTELVTLDRDLTLNEQIRQKLSLQLVDLAYQQAKIALEEVLSSKTASEADKKIAALKLQTLNALEAGKVEQATRTGSAPAQQANQIVAGVSAQQNLGKDTAAMYAEVDRLRQADLISERVAAQAKLQIDANYTAARLQNAQTFFGDLSTLSQSSNATLHAIGKAAAIAQATIDGILAVQKALAAAPPPLNFVLAAASGAAAAANVAKIAGLKDGGWVDGEGGPRDDKVLRRLSVGEHVTNAAAAARNAPLLDAINAGRDVTGMLRAIGTPTRAAAPAEVARSGDFHLHYNPQISNPDPDLGRMFRAQPRELRRAVQSLIANRDIELPRL